MTSVFDKVLDYINTTDDEEKYNSKVTCTGAFLDMITDQDYCEDDEYILDLIADFKDGFCDHGSYCEGCKFYQKLTEIEKEGEANEKESGSNEEVESN